MLALGEDLCAGPGDEDGVLELRRQAAVRRHGRPAVLPHVALDAAASHGQDRLCPEFGTASVSQILKPGCFSLQLSTTTTQDSGKYWQNEPCVPIVNVCPSTICPGMLLPVQVHKECVCQL